MAQLDRLRRRLDKAAGEDELLSELLVDAENYILAYTGREEVPEVLSGIALELACILYNRRGMEGEISHAEGGISIAVEGLPEDLRRVLNRFRVAKVV